MNIKKYIAPFAIAAIFIALSFSLSELVLGSSLIYESAAALIAVFLAYKLWPSNPLTVALVLIIVSIIFPIVVLYAIGNHDNIETSAYEILGHIEWHLLLSPLIAGVGTSIVLRHLTNRSRHGSH